MFECLYPSYTKERYLMGEQERLMLHYISILDARISHAILKEQKEDEK